MGRKKKSELICHCLLIRNEGGAKCSHTMAECETCGWNPIVLEERKEFLRENGLTLCKDGLRRLIM